MKNPKTMKSSIIITSLITCILVSIGIGHAWAKFSTIQQDGADDGVAIRDALRRGGLREAAKLKGHYVGEFDPHWDFGLFDIESLTKNSAIVVVGVPTKQLGGRLAAGGQLILTDYDISVQETIKGYVEPGIAIRVSLVGGRVEFEDGTSAELKTPKFEHMKTGGMYTLFLGEGGSDAPGGYTLTGGPQGLVEIADNGKVKSHGRPTDPVAEQSRDKDKEAFLQEVRQQARKWPQPGKCCS